MDGSGETLDEKLTRDFAKLNRKYFEGALPKLQVLWDEDGEYYGRTTDVDGPLRIILTRKWHMDGRMEKMTLLHEMCHVKLWNTSVATRHGKPFEAEMIRLAVLGAFKGVW